MSIMSENVSSFDNFHLKPYIGAENESNIMRFALNICLNYEFPRDIQRCV